MMPPNVKIDRIGFGIPIGGSLEYLDSLTISKALENKKADVIDQGENFE